MKVTHVLCSEAFCHHVGRNDTVLEGQDQRVRADHLLAVFQRFFEVSELDGDHHQVADAYARAVGGHRCGVVGARTGFGVHDQAPVADCCDVTGSGDDMNLGARIHESTCVVAAHAAGTNNCDLHASIVARLRVRVTGLRKILNC